MASAAKGGASSNVSSQNQIKTFDTLRYSLRQAKDAQGKDLYSHIVEIIDHIVTHCPDEGLDKLEEISYLLKNKEKINMKDFLKVDGDIHYSKPD